tara:strand:+ start:26 stop:193 length:168 start_codon:yes stop_codon:yes gene_type:complete
MTTGDLKEVIYKSKTYYFEWNRMLGWMACDRDRDGVDCPLGVWDCLQDLLDEEKL